MVAGISGTYSGTKVNGTPSHMTEYRRKKAKAAADMFVCGANEQLNEPGGKPILLKHFFQQALLATPSITVDLTIDEEDGEWEIQSGQSDDDILEFRQLDLSSQTADRSAPPAKMPQQYPDQHSPSSPGPPLASGIPKVHVCAFV